MLLLLLLASPLVGASRSAEATLRAGRLSSEEASATGPFLGAFVLDPQVAGGLSLQAAHADVQVDRSERALMLDLGGWGFGVVPSNESSSVASYTDIAWAATSSDGDGRFLVWPLPGGHAELATTGALDVLPSRHGPEVFTAVSTARPDHEVPRAGLAVTGTVVELRGDLRIAFAGVLMEGHADGKESALDTQRHDAPVAGPVGTPARRTVAFEAVADLHGAVLRLPGSAVAAVASLDVAARDMTMAGTHGVLAGAAADGQAVALRGALRARLEPSAPEDSALALVATLAGRLSSATIGTTAVPVDAKAGPPVFVWPLLFALVAATHVRIGRHVFEGIDAALLTKRYADVLGLVRLLPFHPWHRQDAALVAAISLTELGRAEEARRRLLAPRSWAPTRMPTRDFLLARAAVRLGDRAEAVRRLTASLLAEPELRAQVVADPGLAELAGPPPDAVGREAYA